MKKLFIILLTFIALPVFAADLITYDKVESTGGFTWNEESTGGWDAIEVPAGVESVRHVWVQVNDGSGNVSDTRSEFLLSFDSDGAEYMYVDTSGIALSMGKKAGGVLFYIKTSAANQDITVLGLR